PTVQLLGVGIALRSTTALFERVFEYLDLPIDIDEPAHPVALPQPRGHVRFEAVNFGYCDESVLRDITIDVHAGHHLAVVGVTGAGKSTLGHLLSRLYDVEAGRITID